MLTSLDSKNKIISDEVNSNKRENSGSKIPYLKKGNPENKRFLQTEMKVLLTLIYINIDLFIWNNIM